MVPCPGSPWTLPSDSNACLLPSVEVEEVEFQAIIANRVVGSSDTLLLEAPCLLAGLPMSLELSLEPTCATFLTVCLLLWWLLLML